MSDPADDQGEIQGADLGASEDPGQPERPRLRRRPLGYKRADVDEVLGARDRELAELRQDIAALWLAFAQHDRMIRSLGGETPAPLTDRRATPAPDSSLPSPVETEAASIGGQLAELDEVLAAIETATQSLERTYSGEVDAAREAGGQTDPDAEEEGPDEADSEATEASADPEASSAKED